MATMFFEREVLVGDYEGTSAAPYISTTTQLDFGEEYYLEGLERDAAANYWLLCGAREKLSLTNSTTMDGASAPPGKFPHGHSITDNPNVVVNAAESGQVIRHRITDNERVINLQFTDVSTYLAKRIEVFFGRIRGEWQRIWLTDQDSNEFECRWGGDLTVTRVKHDRYSVSLSLIVKVQDFKSIVAA
jgi:hypothetical protein